MRVVLLGDSLSVGSFPSLKEEIDGALLVAKVGAPISWMGSKIDEVMSHHPDVVLVMAGTNDLVSAPVEVVVARLVQLAANFRARGVDVVVSTVPPQTTKNADKVVAYNEQILARNVGGHAVDVGGVLSVKELGPDGIHPTPGGYKKIGMAWAGLLKEEPEIHEGASPMVTLALGAGFGLFLWWSLRKVRL